MIETGNQYHERITRLTLRLVTCPLMTFCTLASLLNAIDLERVLLLIFLLDNLRRLLGLTRDKPSPFKSEPSLSKDQLTIPPITR